MVSCLKNIAYVDTYNEFALNEFSEAFYKCLSGKIESGVPVCILCIGTDRATGDSLGPIVGQKLSESISLFENTFVYGTLETPVHAKNIVEVVAGIYKTHANPLVIAIDASLGETQHVGYLTTGYGSIVPGAGLKKQLQPVGDIFITGIVNFSGVMDFYILQNTRLGLVMRMADIVHMGVTGALLKCINVIDKS